MAGCAAGLQFVGDGALRLVPGRIVIQFEKLGVLAVDALVVVGFEHDPLLARGGVPTAR